MLFTLEKLVYKVVKQMQTLLTDDLTYKLYELYQYEHARGCTPPPPPWCCCWRWIELASCGPASVQLYTCCSEAFCGLLSCYCKRHSRHMSAAATYLPPLAQLAADWSMHQLKC